MRVSQKQGEDWTCWQTEGPRFPDHQHSGPCQVSEPRPAEALLPAQEGPQVPSRLRLHTGAPARAALDPEQARLAVLSAPRPHLERISHPLTLPGGDYIFHGESGREKGIVSPLFPGALGPSETPSPVPLSDFRKKEK